MGKHGPCYHCGVTSTPLWRNGPPHKPVLCNACGSRWRTKGTLENYAPLHMRDTYELDVPKRPKEKTASFKFKVKSLQKGKWSSRSTEAESGTGDYSQSFALGADEDTSNRSSSGSSVSFSESCAHFSSVDASEVTGSIQSDAWETDMPSWKRTSGVRPKRSAVEKLTKDLHSIMHEQSSYLTVSSEEDLLFETHSQTGLIEIGNGSVLIRHPNSAIIEEESEASSPPLQNKSTSLEFSLIMECQSKGSVDSNMSNATAKSSPPAEQSKRDKSSQEKFHILWNKDSKLGSINLEGIVCFEGYMKYLTSEERQQLIKYLPLVDTMEPPDGLKRMFDSPEFLESLSSYQHLLEEGIFDLSASEIKSDDCKILRKLILSNLTKSVWVESYKTHKDAAKASNDGGQGETSFLGCSSRPDLKRPREIHNDKFAELKTIMKTPKKTCKTSQSSLLSAKSIKQIPSELGKKPKIESSSYFDSNNANYCLKSPYALASQKSCIFDPLQLTDVNHDEELLLDVRSSTSFPEAELLPDVWLQKTPAKRSCTESEVSGKESDLLCQSAVSFTSIPPKQW